MTRWITLLMLALGALVPSARAQDGGTPSAVFSQGVEAYRAGDYETASTSWRSLWRAGSEGASELDHAALAYNLGNAAYRLERPLEAAGWYAAALRLSPRDGDLWANLELARERAGLEPADRGDLLATGRRLLNALTLAEAEWSVLVLALLLAVALGVEAYFGGRGPRRAMWISAGLLCVALVPWSWRLATESEAPCFVIADSGLAVRSEPRSSSAEVGRLDPGASVEAYDGVPGWVRVRAVGGLDGWVAEASVLSLAAPGSGS